METERLNTEDEKRRVINSLIILCRHAVNGTVPDVSALHDINMDHLFRAAEKHLLTAAVGMALESAGVLDERFVQAVAQAQRKNALLDADRAKVLSEMEKAGIWYMPLKGAVLKDLYPRYGMRQMADNDILFDSSRADDLKAIMEGLGFTTEEFDRGNHDVYHKKPVSNFEMHRELFDDILKKSEYEYYKNVKDRLVQDEGKEFGFHFTKEDFYVYIIAHEYKHYAGGGTGLRSLLDTYVYLNKTDNMDMEYVRRETEKLGISVFEEENRRLALDLFDGKTLDEKETEMLEYILSSGTYGTIENHARNEISEKGRAGYFFSRLTLSREIMKRNYPILRKAPVLYPAVWLWRLVSKFFSHHKSFMLQLKTALGINKTIREDEQKKTGSV